MNKPTLASLDKRAVKVETQLDERWKQMMARIQRVEMVILGSAGAIILMLVSILTKV